MFSDSAFALMVLYGCANYQDGAQHYKEATAESDLLLFDWAHEHDDARLLNLHGPTCHGKKISKTWSDLPPHHMLHVSS